MLAALRYLIRYGRHGLNGRRAGPLAALAVCLIIAALAAGGPLRLQAGSPPSATPASPGSGQFPAVTPAPSAQPNAATATASGTAATATGTAEAGTYLQAKPLSVQYTFPGNDDVEVDAHALIYVQFTRPVALLTAIEQRPNQPILTFNPPDAGTGKWLTSALYLFSPNPGLAPDTTYTVTVGPDLSDLPDSSLAQAYQWSFTTVRPAVSDVSPRDNTKFVDPATTVQVLFNQPMDHASAQAAFSLTLGASPVAGSVSWTDDQTLIFTPSAPLPRGATLQGALEAGARGAGSQGSGTAKRFAWSFSVSPLPRVVSTDPADGTTAANSFGASVTFSAPMDHASTENAVSIDPAPDPDHLPVFFWSGDTTLRISYAFQPSSTYRISIAGTAIDRYGTAIQAPYSFSFTTAAPSKPLPFVKILAGTQGTLSAYLPASFYLASLNVSQASFSLYSVTAADFRSNSYLNRDISTTPPQSALQKSWTLPIANAVQDQEVQNQFTAGDPLPSGGTLAPGFYLLDVTDGAGDYDRITFEVTHTALVVKRGADDALVWAADLNDGSPVADAPVTLLDSDGNVLTTGTTGSDGTVHLSVGNSQSSPYNKTIYASLARPDDVALATQQWMQGASPYQQNIPYSPYPSVQERGYLYTDRPIYRAGETVHTRFVLRTDDDGHYSLPTDVGDMSLEVTDSRGNNFARQTVQLDGFGSVGADVQLPADGATGNYRISLRSGNTFFGGGSFLVAEFRVPEFAVKLDTDRPAYVNGQTVNANVQADFFFGAHLPDAGLTWQVNASPYSFYPTDRKYSGYSFNDYDFNAPNKNPKSPVDQGAGTTDASGAATFKVSGALGDYPNSERFSITTTITDQNRQQISASKEVIVHHAADYAGVKTEQYITSAGDPVGVDVVTVDTSGAAAPGVSVEAKAYRRVWDFKTQRQPDGSVKYVTSVTDTLVDTHDLTTGADGSTSYSFTPAMGGEYRIVVSGRDSSGNTFQTSTYTYVTSHDFVPWRVADDTTVKLVADKTEYVPGDVAHVLVPAPFAGATGLVTVERGRVLSSSVQSFPTNSTVVDVPITADMAPTVYLAVSLLKPGGGSAVPEYRIGWAKLTVSPGAHALTVDVSPDRTKAGPGDTVNVTVSTTDAGGNGATAEVSLALVDEAVLSLADDRTGAIFPAYWSERPLGVGTGSSLNISVNAENQARQAAAQRSAQRQPSISPTRAATPPPPAPPPPAPTAAAAAQGAPAATVSVRTDFQNTAYWRADVQTGASGKATVSIKLPDNLTTWRLAAKGVTTDTSVGEGKTTILTQRDIVVRPVAPRFFIAGDQTHLEALVTNLTDTAQDVDVTLSAENLSVDGATQRITVPPGKSAGAAWDTSASEGPPVKLTFTAQAVNGPGDAVQVTLPVNPRSTPETVASSGIVTDQSVQETVQIPGFARQDKGSIDLSINASLVGVLREASVVLETWLHEPADVTAARLLSRVGSWQAAVALNQPLDVQSAHSVTAVAAIQRLQSIQTGSGAWCWWQPCFFPSPEITARVLYALGVAREAGFDVNSDTLDRGVRYLAGQYDRSTDVAYQLNPNTRAFWLLATSQAGRGSRSRDDDLFAKQRGSLGGSGLGALLDALLLDGADASDPEVQGLAGDIASTGNYSAAGSHWEDADDQHPGYTNSTEATSLVLLAAVRLDPTQPLLDGAMRWLTGTRSNGYWRSTSATAIAVSAIAEYVAAREQPVQGTTYTVDVNGITIANGDFSDADPGATQQVSEPLAGLPTDTPLPVTIDKQGGGQLYYSLYLHYFAPTDEVSALSNGITVSHEVLPENGDDAVSTVKAGGLVRVRITVAAPTDLQFVQVDDYLPAGLEAVDSSLKTTDPNLIKRQQQDVRNLQLPANQPGAARLPFYYFYYYNPFDHVEVRDDRVSLFATSLTKGVHQYIYYARATTAGTFMQPPVVAVETDFPDIFARSDSNILTVTP